MTPEELDDLMSRRERYATDIQEFCDVYVGEYVRGVSWRWTGNDPEDFEAVVVLELYDGSTRRVPLDYYDDENAMAIRVGGAGSDLPLDAGGLYAYLWNRDATELRKAVEALAEARRANALLRQHNMQLLARLARALYDLESGDCALEFHEQTVDVQKAYIDRAWAEAMDTKDAGDNPVSAGAGDGPRPDGGDPVSTGGGRS